MVFLQIAHHLNHWLFFFFLSVCVKANMEICHFIVFYDKDQSKMSSPIEQKTKSGILEVFVLVSPTMPVDFDCWYIGTHTKEKPSKISNIEAFFSSKYFNLIAILSTL